MSIHDTPVELNDAITTEYSQLSSYFSTVVGFRITLLGFYIAAIGFIIGGQASQPTLSFHVRFFGLLLTISMFLFELRTRTLFYRLAKRAVYIEQEHWNFKSRLNKELPLFSHHMPSILDEYLKENQNELAPKELFYRPELHILGNTIPLPIELNRVITHSFALDILYIFAIVFFAIGSENFEKYWSHIVILIGVIWLILSGITKKGKTVRR